MCDHPENLRACKGASTVPDGDMERCQACGDAVAHDLVNHPFWGFASSCPHKQGKAEPLIPEALRG